MLVRNMWDAKLHKVDVVVVFGVPEIMSKLEKKFARELESGTTVVRKLCA